LLTYDRRPKIAPENIARIHERLFGGADPQVRPEAGLSENDDEAFSAPKNAVEK
jgi:hypothetical protein